MVEINPNPLDLDASENEQLEPTEREEHFFKAMIDAADGSTPEELEPTERREHWYSGIINAIQNGGGGGSSGGSVLVVGVTVSGELENVYTLDKTWQEINDADYAVTVMRDENGNTYGTILYTQFVVPLNKYSVGVEGLFTEAVDFDTNSASGYPTYTNE